MIKCKDGGEKTNEQMNDAMLQMKLEGCFHTCGVST